MRITLKQAAGRCVGAFALSVVVTTLPISPACSQSDPAASGEGPSNWTFNLAPYLFLTGVTGSITNNLTYPINASLGDILDNLRLGLFLSFEGHERRWGFFTDFQYTSLAATGSGQDSLEVQLDNLIVEGDVTYAAHDDAPLKFLAGVRVYNMEQTLMFPTMPDQQVNTTVVDPVLGARGNFELSDRWRFDMRGDIGGFGVSSEFTYQLAMNFIWQFASRWGMQFGYRILAYQIISGSIQTDIRMSGLTLGVDYSF